MSDGNAKTYIPDGYTIRAGIEPVERLHSGLRFEFRPMTPRQVSQYLTEKTGATASQDKAIQAKFIENHVSEWNLTSGDGKQLPVSKDAVLDHMNPAVSVELFEIIAGFNPASEIAGPEGYDNWFKLGDNTKNS